MYKTFAQGLGRRLSVRYLLHKHDNLSLITQNPYCLGYFSIIVSQDTTAKATYRTNLFGAYSFRVLDHHSGEHGSKQAGMAEEKKTKNIELTA